MFSFCLCFLTDQTLSTRTPYLWGNVIYVVHLFGYSIILQSPHLLHAGRLQMLQQISSLSSGNDHQWIVCYMPAACKIIPLHCCNFHCVWTHGRCSNGSVDFAGFGMRWKRQGEPSMGLPNALFRTEYWYRSSACW